MNYLPTTAKEKKPLRSRHIFTRLLYFGGFDYQSRRFFFYLNSNDNPLPCKSMAALGGNCHALINLSTEIDIIHIIKKSHYPPTGYSGYVDELSNQLNTAVISYAFVCILQAGAFCIL